MSSTQLGAGSLDAAGQANLAAVFIDLPADVIVESCTVNYGGGPDNEDIFDEDGKFHTRFVFEHGGSVAFTGGGIAEPIRGTLLTGDSSGASAYLIGIQLDSGSWSGGNAAGNLVLSGLTGGTAFSAEDVTASGLVSQANILTLSAAVTSVAMHTATIVLVGKRYTNDAGTVDGIATNEQYYIDSNSEEVSKSAVRTTINVTLLPTEIS